MTSNRKIRTIAIWNTVTRSQRPTDQLRAHRCWPHRLVGVVVLCLAMTLAACTNSAPQDTAGIPLPNSAAANPETNSSADSSADSTQPGIAEAAFDVVGIQRQYRQLAALAGSARSHLANDCMAEQGFPRLPVALPLPLTNPDDVSALGALRLDPDTVATEGYWSTPLLRRVAVVDPREALQQSIDPDIYDETWYTAWAGEATATVGTGCLPTAGDQLLGAGRLDEVYQQIENLERLRGDIYDQSNVDELYLRSEAEWRSCMTAQGFDQLATIEAAYQRGNQLHLEDEPAALRLAVADSSCQVSTGVIDAYDRAWRSYEVAVTQSTLGQDAWRWYQANYDDLLAMTMDYLTTAGLT